MLDSSVEDVPSSPAVVDDLSHAPSTDQSFNGSAIDYPLFEAETRKKDAMQIFEQIRKAMKRPIRIQKIRGREVIPKDSVVFFLKLSDTASLAYESIVNIGFTTKTTAEPQRHWEGCLRSRSLDVAHESSCRRLLYNKKLERLVDLTLGAYRICFRCYRCPNSEGGRQHKKFFAVSPEMASSIVDLWRTWLDTNPYKASGKLSAFWQRRLDETRAELRDDFDLDVVLRLMLQPMNVPRPLAQELRSDLLAWNNTSTLLYDGDQELNNGLSEIRASEGLCQDVTRGSMKAKWPLHLKGCSRVVLPLVIPLAWMCTLSWLNHTTLCKIFIWSLRLGGWVMSCCETSCRMMFWLFRFGGQVMSFVEATFVFVSRI